MDTAGEGLDVNGEQIAMTVMVVLMALICALYWLRDRRLDKLRQRLHPFGEPPSNIEVLDHRDATQRAIDQVRSGRWAS